MTEATYHAAHKKQALPPDPPLVLGTQTNVGDTRLLRTRNFPGEKKQYCRIVAKGKTVGEGQMRRLGLTHTHYYI